MAFYKKKPVVVQAEKLSPDNATMVAEWCGGMQVTELGSNDEKIAGINIPTLEGTMRASEGDYVIKGVKGEFYPCKPEIFEATYEQVQI